MITLNSKLWIFASILYLALPVILWLAGWIQPCFSIPLIALLATGLCLIYRKLPARQITVPRFPWVISLILIFLAVWLLSDLTVILNRMAISFFAILSIPT